MLQEGDINESENDTAGGAFIFGSEDPEDPQEMPVSNTEDQEIIDVDPMNDVIREPEFERTIDLTNGANKVQNCRTYTDEVYRGDDNSKDRFEALMA